MKEVNLNKIKLIIWDLDDTFWKGTLSEEGIIPIDNNIELIRLLTLRGIVNSICSKNDEDYVINKLKELNIDEYFVFNSINWLPKGKRIKELIENMQLRDVNVLFIDDNISNLQEAKFYCPDLMVSTPEIIDELYEKVNTLGKDDNKLSRLEQYKILEKKKEDSKQVSTNEEFLFDCKINVDIDYDCLKNIDRIYELNLRSNQLNFTKLRSSKEELIEDIKTCDDCGAVLVKDKYGDYGLCGFYLLKEGSLKHFTFSCRAMGMGIEQYVYLLLKKPELKINGDVVSDLNQYEKIEWINQIDKEENKNLQNKINSRSLFKGPCDMQQLFSFINSENNIDCEFTFINEKGVSNESWNHTIQILESERLSDEKKNDVIAELPFADEKFFNTKMFSGNYKFVFLSLLTDPNLGVYRRKKDGVEIAFCEWCHDLTDISEWENYINGKNFGALFKFTNNFLKDFKDKYEYVGRISPQKICDNIKEIRKLMPKETILVLLTGSEIKYNKNKKEAYVDREKFHKELNGLLNSNVNEENVKIINFTDYIKDEDDYSNNINHFKKSVYYNVANKIVEIVNTYSDNNVVELKSKNSLYFQTILSKFTSNPIVVKLRTNVGSFLRKVKKSI